MLLPSGAAAVRGGDGGAAGFRKPRNLLLLGGAAHRDRVDAVRVAIAVARVLLAPTVARRPHEDGALAVATLQRENGVQRMACVGEISTR